MKCRNDCWLSSDLGPAAALQQHPAVVWVFTPQCRSRPHALHAAGFTACSKRGSTVLLCAAVRTAHGSMGSTAVQQGLQGADSNIRIGNMHLLLHKPAISTNVGI